MRLAHIAALFAGGPNGGNTPSDTSQTVFPGPAIAGASVWRGASGIVNRTSGTQITLPGFRSGWAGIIKASGASLAVTMSSGSTTDAVEVSVDGGAFSFVSIVGGRAQLFTGLADAEHQVIVRPRAGYGDAIIANAGDTLTLAGSGTSVTMAATWAQVGDTGNFVSPTFKVAHGLTGYTPDLAPRAYNAATFGSNTPSVAFNADCAMLIVVSKTQKVVVVAGTGSATVHSNTIGNGDAVNVHFIPCTAGLKRYTVSAGRSNVQFPVFSVGVVGSLGMHGIAGFIDQFGDSITEGNRYAWGAVETFEVAHKLGRAGETFGVSGNNTLQLRDRLELFSWTRSAADVAVLAIGVNDAGPGWTDTQTGYYTTCINTLLAHGYGRVLCRHMLPTAANYAAINAGITAAAAACSDPSKVRVISTAGWPQFSLIQVDLDESGNPDGLHLSEPEYVAAVPYCVSAYTEALA